MLQFGNALNEGIKAATQELIDSALFDEMFHQRLMARATEAGNEKEAETWYKQYLSDQRASYLRSLELYLAATLITEEEYLHYRQIFCDAKGPGKMIQINLSLISLPKVAQFYNEIQAYVAERAYTKIIEDPTKFAEIMVSIGAAENKYEFLRGWNNGLEETFKEARCTLRREWEIPNS